MTDAERLREFERIAAQLLDELKTAGYVKRATIEELKPLCPKTNSRQSPGKNSETSTA